MQGDKATVDTRRVVLLRNALREKGLVRGYPATVMHADLADQILQGLLDPIQGVRQLLERRPEDAALKAWLDRQLRRNGSAPNPEPEKTEQKTGPAASDASEADKPEPDGREWGVDPNYIPGPAAQKALRLLRAGKPVYLVGPAGSGKSMALRWCAWQLRRPLVFVSMHAHVMADSLEGYSWLTVKDGVTVQEWCEGVIERALTLGAVLIVDEFDRAPAAVQHLLNDVLQSRSFTLREGPRAGQKITATDGFIVAATGNTLSGSTGEYTATSLDRATLSRFRVLYVDYDTQAERKLLESFGLNGTAERILQAVARARDLYRQGELPAAVGTRHLIHLAEDLRDGFTLQEAWEQNVALLQGDPQDPAYHRAMALVR